MASSVTATLHTMVLSLLFPSVVHMHMGHYLGYYPN